MPLPQHPILVVSYIDETRTALAGIVNKTGAVAVPCANFCEAENLALKSLYSGMLVDLPSIIKSKGEEKIVAYTLANFFPTLRVRTMGGMLIPMAMPGSAKQDKNLDDFLNKTCEAFMPRTLREFKRHSVYCSTTLHYNDKEYRGFTGNISWGGAFIVDVYPEKFTDGGVITVDFLNFGFSLDASIQLIKPWGERFPPGIGIMFRELNESALSTFSTYFKTTREFDRDRLTT
ncbi:MAG: PilZ domain-containing protein [Desulfuromonadaceae bacterium]|nr:PilZ domain-containing protein [Desulfuromonadaceae bacterium]MDD2855279.1 PilZ domain-containing protein [Desulfuromonadaceae bacterium]